MVSAQKRKNLIPIQQILTLFEQTAFSNGPGEQKSKKEDSRVVSLWKKMGRKSTVGIVFPKGQWIQLQVLATIFKGVYRKWLHNSLNTVMTKVDYHVSIKSWSFSWRRIFTWSNLMVMDTLGIFSTLFTKENNFHAFLFACLYTKRFGSGA